MVHCLCDPDIQSYLVIQRNPPITFLLDFLKLRNEVYFQITPFFFCKIAIAIRSITGSNGSLTPSILSRSQREEEKGEGEEESRVRMRRMRRSCCWWCWWCCCCCCWCFCCCCCWCSLHNFMGVAYLELGRYDRALKDHQMDYDLAVKQ